MVVVVGGMSSDGGKGFFWGVAVRGKCWGEVNSNTFYPVGRTAVGTRRNPSSGANPH